MEERDETQQHKKGLTKKQKAFLAAYAQCGNITGAAEAAKLNRSSHYDWMRDSVTYCEAFARAEEEAADRLEKEARRRAIDGVEEPVFQGGKEVGKVKRYSDNLLMFLLKGARPQKFKERHEMSGPNNGPVQTVVHTGIDLGTVSDDELDKELKKLEVLTGGVNRSPNQGTQAPNT